MFNPRKGVFFYMVTKKIVSAKNFEVILQRLCYQIIENFNLNDEAVIIGIQSNGAQFMRKLLHTLKGTSKDSFSKFQYGYLDITFFRDDFRTNSEVLKANQTDIPFSLEGKRVILVDDVLYTGRSIRSAMDALNSFGRPKSIHLLVLVDRRFSREVPIQADFVGIKVDTMENERVYVKLNKPVTGPAEIYIQKK
jgi:pyrimidine operon attenuation protein/uracil phosphoribosyltransferase